ncbi:MAG TPA: hypothetical protein VJS92_14515, partial [Candidatus Polarisedimenticolaceae bacterium]|nr:hypothetical protein [Candidatus Polarisedimenticolaceae bacterium]
MFSRVLLGAWLSALAAAEPATLAERVNALIEAGSFAPAEALAQDALAAAAADSLEAAEAIGLVLDARLRAGKGADPATRS